MFFDNDFAVNIIKRGKKYQVIECNMIILSLSDCFVLK